MHSPTLVDMEKVVAVVVAYLVGSIDFGVIVPRLMGIDIYREGSGNPGTANVFRTLGKKAAAVVLTGDMLKGALSVWLGATIADPAFAYWCAVAAVIGHSYPVWHKFSGGKGVATGLGAALYLQPLVGAAAVIVWIGFILKTKTSSLASLIAVAMLLPGFALRGVDGGPLLATAVLVAIVFGRHTENIKRMLAGGENTLETR